ncbi:MAG: DNA repair ATPase, partial [Bacteroidota bacterium]
MTDLTDTAGAYEIIRARLEQQSSTLGDKLKTLNSKRVETFGSTQMTVLGQTRIRTENNCIPRDLLNVAGKLLFGYNVFVGMKSEIAVNDVFNYQAFEETETGVDFYPVSLEECFLSDPKFTEHFKELYRYYKDAKLIQLRNAHGKKLAVFQIGRTHKDVKVFRWAVDNELNVNYLDNRGERDNTFPPSHDIEWIETTRDNHITGKSPHVSILDIVFVETINGTLTVKLENNTEEGLGIYEESVEDPNQSLADAQIAYAQIGNLILLKICPYREEQFRYLIFNQVTEQVTRIDAIGQGCIQLPEDHGVMFPGGYYLKSGDYKLFEGENFDDMQFLQQIKSPNGEDV